LSDINRDENFWTDSDHVGIPTLSEYLQKSPPGIPKEQASISAPALTETFLQAQDFQRLKDAFKSIGLAAYIDHLLNDTGKEGEGAAVILLIQERITKQVRNIFFFSFEVCVWSKGTHMFNSY